MSTQPTLPSDPQAMPLEQLKQEAGLAQPAQPAPAPTPAPVVPEAFTVQQDDNGVTIQLAPEYGGEVFKGKDWAEAAQKLAKSKADTNAYVKQLKNQPAQPAPAAQPAQPAEPQVSPEEKATRDWILAQQAAALGMTPEQYLARVNMVFETTEKMAINTAFADFVQACPDYADTPDNAKVLAEYFPDNMDHFPTAQELKMAYAMALYDKKLTPSAQQPQQPKSPPPMPGVGASPQLTASSDPWSMPLDQLGKAAGIK